MIKKLKKKLGQNNYRRIPEAYFNEMLVWFLSAIFIEIISNSEVIYIQVIQGIIIISAWYELILHDIKRFFSF